MYNSRPQAAIYGSQPQASQADIYGSQPQAFRKSSGNGAGPGIYAAIYINPAYIFRGFIMSEQIKENKMGTMPIGRLLITMSLPMIVSMLIQALYNIVDSMYVSMIGESALTAVSLVFPMQNLIISIASGTGVGINALLSRALGEKEFGKAEKVAQHALFLGLVVSVITACVMLLIAVPFAAVQTSDPTIYNGTVTYMRICCGICFGIFMQITMERLLTSTGKTMLTMVSQATGAIINIILDPVLIFGYGPFPEMGIAGAAAATVFAQFVSAGLGIFLNTRYNKEISLNMKGFRPDGKLIREIYRIGIPSIIMMCIGSIMTFGMNMILIRYLNSSTAAAVFGVYFKLNSFIFMPIFGLNNGMVPIIAFNFGARHKKRIQHTYHLAAILAVVVMTIGMLLFWIIPDLLLGIFNASDQMLEIGRPALRIIATTFPVAGYAIVTGSVMQALGRSMPSMIISITRQLAILLPSALLLAIFGGLDAVWWSFDIAEVSSVILTIIFYHRVHKELIAPLPD